MTQALPDDPETINSVLPVPVEMSKTFSECQTLFVPNEILRLCDFLATSSNNASQLPEPDVQVFRCHRGVFSR